MKNANFTTTFARGLGILCQQQLSGLDRHWSGRTQPIVGVSVRPQAVTSRTRHAVTSRTRHAVTSRTRHAVTTSMPCMFEWYVQPNG
jgi:hypothetical protein